MTQEKMTVPWSIWDASQLMAGSARLWTSCSVALGVFDGVHRGHQAILNKAVARGAALSCPPVALTFDRHPAQTVAPHRNPLLLTPFAQKIEYIIDQGIHHVIVVRFDAAFAQTDPRDFVADLLVEGLGARSVVVGYDFRFGRHASGNTDLLQQMADTHGFELNIVSAVTEDSAPVSSTEIRRLLTAGDVAQAQQGLGRAYVLSGIVVSGDGRGRTIGYPTANLELDPQVVIPADGVYATLVDGERQGLTIIGTRPSFTEDDTRVVETHILDYSADLYGQTLQVAFLHRIRGIVRFDSAEQFVKQAHRDVETARRFFKMDEDSLV